MLEPGRQAWAHRACRTKGAGAAVYNVRVRDRRWDFLYDRQRQPVKEYVLGRFADELAAEIEAWPPPDLAWTSEAEQTRWSVGAAAHPRHDVIRLALEIARLDLAHEFERMDTHREREAHRLWSPAEEAALHLLERLVTEACLELRERADRIRIGRADLIAAIDRVERRLFRVTIG